MLVMRLYCENGRYNGSPTHTIIHADNVVLSYAAAPNDAPPPK